MQAMVLTAGFGTRLAHLTRTLPKPMLRVHGRPLVEYILRNLAWYDIRHVWLNLHYLPEVIQGYFGNGAALGLELRYSPEPQLLGTAGGARRMWELAGKPAGPWLIHYGDVVTDQDLAALVRLHGERKAQVTMLMHQRPGSNSVVECDAAGRVTRFLERPTAEERQDVFSPWVNSGICVCEAEVLESIVPDRPGDWARDVLARLVPQGRVFAMPLSGYRCAVDSVERLHQVQLDVATGRCRTPWSSHRTLHWPAA